ncbi:hypothetical protein [Halegenticoccus soli]|uniref:hypothetical protein n=1 Tax=Halegenticoccus soli TaxID=1985678 RepID=UPI0018EC28C1|nr:hypothetical protein [Halegenticoccus soli]
MSIYSKHHFAISVLVGAAFALAVESPFPAWFVVAYAAAVGVGIDFDHFLVARLNTGSWRAASGCLRDPRRVFAGQDDIFEAGEVGTLRRLLSHVIIAGIAVPLVYALSPVLALLTALSLYAHLLSDLVWDVYAEAKRGSPEVPTAVRE